MPRRKTPVFCLFDKFFRVGDECHVSGLRVLMKFWEVFSDINDEIREALCQLSYRTLRVTKSRAAHSQIQEIFIESDVHVNSIDLII